MTGESVGNNNKFYPSNSNGNVELENLYKYYKSTGQVSWVILEHDVQQLTSTWKCHWTMQQKQTFDKFYDYLNNLRQLQYTSRIVMNVEVNGIKFNAIC